MMWLWIAAAAIAIVLAPWIVCRAVFRPARVHSAASIIPLLRRLLAARYPHASVVVVARKGPESLQFNREAPGTPNQRRIVLEYPFKPWAAPYMDAVLDFAKRRALPVIPGPENRPSAILDLGTDPEYASQVAWELLEELYGPERAAHAFGFGVHC